MNGSGGALAPRHTLDPADWRRASEALRPQRGTASIMPATKVQAGSRQAPQPHLSKLNTGVHFTAITRAASPDINRYKRDCRESDNMSKNHPILVAMVATSLLSLGACSYGPSPTSGLRKPIYPTPAPPPAPPKPAPAPAPPPPPPPVCEAGTMSGCDVGDKIVLRGVNFDFDKDSLTINAKTILDDVAAALKKRSDIEVEIAGHTDSMGSDSYNQSLSDRRAQSVRAYLISMGIAASRMTSVGYGESRPVASNDSEDGRAENRRVELEILRSNGGMTMSSSPAPMAAAPAPTKAAPAAASGSAAVTIADFAFSPEDLTVASGTTVTWTNEDGSNHFVTFSDQGSDRLREGATYSRTFSNAGEYSYACSIHPSMTGTVMVQ